VTEAFLLLAQVGQCPPCACASKTVEVITAIGVIVTGCFTAYLAHRRIMGDRVANERYNAQLLGMANVISEVKKANGHGEGIGPSGP